MRERTWTGYGVVRIVTVSSFALGTTLYFAFVSRRNKPAKPCLCINAERTYADGRRSKWLAGIQSIRNLARIARPAQREYWQAVVAKHVRDEDGEAGGV